MTAYLAPTTTTSLPGGGRRRRLAGTPCRIKPSIESTGRSSIVCAITGLAVAVPWNKSRCMNQQRKTRLSAQHQAGRRWSRSSRALPSLSTPCLAFEHGISGPDNLLRRSTWNQTTLTDCGQAVSQSTTHTCIMARLMSPLDSKTAPPASGGLMRIEIPYDFCFDRKRASWAVWSPSPITIRTS